ncbi:MULTISPECIES: vWA domain-containing protein [unclassified Agarivorans]|uniref:vWA domain-containing protein n=1 Tax=unclassified Agarivorans TaxID=2636026 RepID=UPI0026E19852|nr:MULTISPECIES: VWA domain-containing protein [unclassified Agarivorans]MDO6687273.1 VWA domain-containing protein [Agarivorans sp. 3_MG-2023]MDO6716800.1 VWA domain-containing protein [Agarivorans sp. 2_MG-2023]
MFDGLFWQQIVSQFHFIRPWWLLCLLPFSAIVWVRWQREQQSKALVELPKHLRKALTVGDAGWKKLLPLKLLALMALLAIVMSAGPTWQRQASPFGEDKASLLIVLDNSLSMLEQDIAPSRIERAKQKVSDLLALRAGGKTGLVVFAGSAHLAMPLTEDKAVFAPFLAAIDPDIMPLSGKSAASAFPLIEQQFAASQQTGSVLLISDGVDTEAISAYQQFFAKHPQQLLILTMANSNSGQADIASLKQLASASNGRMQSVTIDADDVQWLNQQVERHMQLSGDSAMPWQDMGYYLLFPFSILILLWFRRGWLVQWCLVGCVGLSLATSPNAFATMVESKAQAPLTEETLWSKSQQAWMNLWLTSDQQGQWYFNRYQYEKAAERYTQPLDKGVAYYYAKRFDLAHQYFLQVESNNALFYAANALAHQREYIAARNLYQHILDKTPNHSAAQHNLVEVQKIIDEINQFSESQTSSPDEPEGSIALPDDQPQTSDGADEQVMAHDMRNQTLTAEQLLGSEELADKWLQRVEADPKLFLRSKFRVQQQQAVSKAAELASKGEE